MSAVFIAGAGTDVGKTFVACGLIRALRTSGVAVDALKPIVSGFDDADWSASDPAHLLRALDRGPSAAALDAISPYRYRAPLAPDLAARLEGRAVDFDAVADLCRRRVKANPPGQVLVIEGVGGVMSPISDHATGLDLMTGLDLPAILVGGSYLGAISHTLTAWSVLRANGVSVLAIALSESDGDAPPLDETAASLTRLTGEVPVVVVPRRGSSDEAFGALAGRVLGRRGDVPTF